MTWSRYLFLIWASIFVCSSETVADDVVWFISDGNNESHQKYIRDIEPGLRDAVSGVTIRQAVTEGDKITATSDDRVLIISVGAKAAQEAAQYGYPTINSLITRRTYDSLKGSYRASLSAVYLDQPVIRHLQLIKVALPSRTRVAVLIGSDMPQLVTEMKRQAAAINIDLKPITVDDESGINTLFGREILAEDTLLLLPDPAVVNRNTVKPLVLGSYRQGVPLVGYSEALVKAGALMAVHSSLPVLEREVLDMVKVYFARSELPAPRYPNGMKVSVNYQLARALKLTLPSEHSLTQSLQEQLQ